MPNLTVNFACELYDRVFPLYAGEVKPRGVDLNFVAVGRARQIFDRMADPWAAIMAATILWPAHPLSSPR